MNPTKRKVLLTINATSELEQKQTLSESKKEVQPVSEKIQKVLPIALKDEPKVEVVQEEVLKEEIKEETVELPAEEKVADTAKLKKNKKVVDNE